ncbi:inverse autotransporter beta domain-containing protein [Escherichia coli]|nr:inverse autotransporter beta domain-containing protein [Escherichia coli]MCQ5518015.1 inverse autotransporter beta domain-containing protein [Escherichia coli]MCQ5553203.1 inverse autotransporter beta domain-containing protein [Escherichia coli]MCQ5564466.1 inverse autotransporter beta domain-containing protein [Escherichia coli]MCQ5584683.1 inverse autotransporter beta domain-containing protein [Escherichia coli]
MKQAIGYSMIALQVFFQVSPAFAGIFRADEQSVAQTAMEAGRVLQGNNSGDAARQVLTSQVSGQTADAVTQYLNQFGTAKAQLSVDSDFSLKGSSLDVLLPLYNTPKNVLFTQLGMRDNDGRFTTNVGLGHRHFMDNGWMLGYNVFYDVDWRNTNRRYGIGVEAWRDYLKVSANGYKRLSDWRQSPTVTDYDERPADGWDIRAEGWLPAYPQLGGKLVYEQYYGNEVALFGESERQKNPHAITAGITYTPFPLLTAGVDYRRGKNGADDTRLNLGLTYRIGEPLAHQLDSGYVGVKRSLAANRLELVNRNNDVVLEYRKQTLITLLLPPDVYGAELTTVTLTPQVNAKYGLSRIELDDAELRQAGGKVISNNGQQITLQLPAWSSDRQSITLSGRARDTRGNLSDIARTRILVFPAVQQQLAVSTDKTTATADGADSVQYTLSVTGSDGKPISGQAVRWNHNGGTLNGEHITNADGVAVATLTSQTTGVIQVTATTRNQTAKAADVTFVAAMQGELLADRTQALADGKEAVSYTLTLKTTDGKPLSGKNVTFTTTAGQLSQTQGTTNQNGQLSVQLTSTRAGQAVVNASVDGSVISAAPVTFERTLDSTIVVNKTSAVADGQDSIILTAVIRDAAGIPVAGQAVTWHTDRGQFSQQDAVTNAAGAASASLSSTQAGTAQVSLSLNGTTDTVNAPRVSFTEQLHLTLQAGKTTAVADGNDSITYTLNVRDAAGQPMKDKAVQWTTDLGTLSSPQGTTSAQGEATVTLTSTQAGQAVVNATVDGKQISAQPVTFTRTVRGVITVEKEHVYPGSKQTVTLTLTDAAGNPVSGERVDWHTDSGNLWQTQGTTDAQGRATTTWESTTPGTVSITADAYGQQYSAPVITVMAALTVSNVTGIDATGADGKNFGKRVPNSTWPGAKFRIDTENAAGTVTWTASSPAVSINGNVMTVKSNPAGVTLTGTDADGQTVTLNMGSNWFAQSATKWEWLSGDYDGTAIYSCRQLGAQVASSSALQGIISEWGELETYDGWTNLKNNWLYSSTTVISGNGVKSTIAYYFPGGQEGQLSGIRGYYACH